MDLKRNDSVVCVVFLRSKTKLMDEVSAAVHLTVIILFMFPENTESLTVLFGADHYLVMYLLS